MLNETDLTTDQLLDAWRQAELEVNGIPLGTPEHESALRKADQTRGAYIVHLDDMKEDLRDG